MDTLVTTASEIKSLGSGRFCGYLVRFSDENSPDLAGDFFSIHTDFGFEAGEIKQTPVYYNHALDPTLKTRKIGTATMQIKDAGVWFEGQLEKSDAYVEAVDKLLGMNRLGASSGTASHLVEREAKGKAFHIKHWPLGLDASLTPEPCDPYNHVVSIKSVSDNIKSIADLLREIEGQDTPEVKAADVEIEAEAEEEPEVLALLQAMPIKNYLETMGSVVSDLDRRLTWYVEDRTIKSGRTISADNLRAMGEIADGMDSVSASLDTHRKKLRAMVEAHTKPAANTPNIGAREFSRYLAVSAPTGTVSF